MLVFNPDGGSVPGPMPAISIVSVGQQMMITWTSAWSGFTLQAKEVLSSSDGWITVTNPPVVNGDQYTVMIEAHSGSEFYRLAPSLTFQPGETNKTFGIVVIGERLNEADETFFVNLSNATNAVIPGTGAVIKNVSGKEAKRVVNT